METLSLDAEKKTFEKTEQLLDELQNRNELSIGEVQMESSISMNTLTITQDNTTELPQEFNHKDAIYWVSDQPAKLDEILRGLKKITGLSFYLKVGFQNQFLEFSNGDRDYNKIFVQNLKDAGLNQPMQITFQGNLFSVLNQIARHFDLTWRNTPQGVYFQQYSLQNYQLEIFPSKSQTTSTTVTTSTQVELNLFEEVQTTLEELVGENGQVSFIESTGTFFVNTTPSVHQRIFSYFDHFNDQLGQQIAIDVTVLNVALEKNHGVGGTLNAIVGELGNNFIQLTESNALKGASSFANVGIIKGDVNLHLILGRLNQTSEVSVETSTGATTSNNRLVPIQVVKDIAYAKTVELVPNDSGSNTISITPGQISTGFEMTILPRVLNQKEILLHYSIELSELGEIKEFTTNNQTIQLPNVMSTAFEQQAIIGNGETLVLAGFERDQYSRKKRSKGLLGSTESVENTRTSTVVMIKPRLLKRNPH